MDGWKPEGISGLSKVSRIMLVYTVIRLVILMNLEEKGL